MPSCIRRTNRLPFLAAPWLCFHRTFSTITKNQIFSNTDPQKNDVWKMMLLELVIDRFLIYDIIYVKTIDAVRSIRSIWWQALLRKRYNITKILRTILDMIVLHLHPRIGISGDRHCSSQKWKKLDKGFFIWNNSYSWINTKII